MQLGKEDAGGCGALQRAHTSYFCYDRMVVVLSLGSLMQSCECFGTGATNNDTKKEDVYNTTELQFRVRKTKSMVCDHHCRASSWSFTFPSHKIFLACGVVNRIVELVAGSRTARTTYCNVRLRRWSDWKDPLASGKMQAEHA